MNEQELRSLVERMVLELAGQPNAAAPAKAAPVTAAAAAGGCLDDITETDLRRQYLVKNPRNGPAFLDLKLRTPARLGLGRAGARYQTLSMLRMRADHAAAQDSVFSHVDDAFVEKNGFVPVQTLCQNKDEYLTRPDRGRRFDEAARAGLKTYGLESGPVLFIKYCRVGASDHIGELTGAEAVCLLVGERPGLVTAESMSAYLTYKPHIGIPESKRTVISNIHRQGTTAVEAGAHIAELIKTMLEKKASGIDLK